MHTPRHTNSNNYSFFLGRHGQSILNAGEKVQGKAQGRGDTPWNGLTDKGREQAQSIYPALNAAGIAIAYVSSSRLLRARETAEVFIDSHPDPKPLLKQNHISNLEEVSQAGWEMEYTREEVMKAREDSLVTEIENLIAEGLSPDLKGHVAWIATLGTTGESPLTAALRGIRALEEHGAEPGELVISHNMLNRYMDAIATHIGNVDRSLLFEMHLDSSGPLEKIAVLQTLQDLGLPPYDADHNHNRVANGGVTEYTIDNATGRWTASRRIEPPAPLETAAFIEYRRNEDGVWTRTVSDKELAAN